MNSISKNAPENKCFCVANMSRGELMLLVSALADLLDEHIDAILTAAIDEEFLTMKRISEFVGTQKAAALIAEAFATECGDGDCL